MKKNLAFCRFAFVAFLFALFASSVYAADVAYIYRSESKVDERVLDVFSKMSLSVERIDERRMPKDFSDYKLVYIGDEKLKRVDEIEFGEAPMVMMSGYNGKKFGITDRDGMSRKVANAPLTVVAHGKELKVYSASSGKMGRTIQYYYLSADNKAKSADCAASTKKAGSKNKDDDVIAYFAPGSKLENGKTTKAAACFFGITESEYWTDDAEGLFKECVKFVLNALEESSACDDDVDCGSDGFVEDRMCLNGNAIRKFRTFTCNNAGTVQSACSHSDENRVVETCLQGCAEGICVGSSQLIHDVALVNVTNTVGPIRIQTTDGVEVFADESLECDEKYRVTIRVRNLGNFTENITFVGGTDGLDIEHGEVSSLESGKTSDRTKTINFTLTEGDHELTFEAIISGFTDANLLNNVAKRSVHVSCGKTFAECSQNQDCGTDGFIGNGFCLGNDVGKKYRLFSCNGVCSFREEDRVFETCPNGCLNGACISATDLIHDIALVNVTNAVGTIRVRTTEGDDVPAGAPLECGQKYQIAVRAKNLGNYTEDVVFTGYLGSMELIHGSISGLAPGKTSDRTRTVNVTLPTGNYDLTVAANLDGAVDANLGNNVVTKRVSVVC